jgi:nucleoside-diphosphate-sugar epimerase
MMYGARFQIPYVIIRPGWVYGPGNEGISNRVGIRALGFFIHLGGRNSVPLCFVENCAEAIVQAGFKEDMENQIFNVVDDHLPSSRDFLSLYRKNVENVKVVPVPHLASYVLCWLWECYCKSFHKRIHPSLNTRSWHTFWKKTAYPNQKIKQVLGWKPLVSSTDALNRYFESCRQKMLCL